VVFAAHPIEQLHGEERAVFADIQLDARARTQVLKLVRTLDVSAFCLELANLALHFDWMSRAEFRRLVVGDAHELVRGPLTLETVDILCEIVKHEPLGDSFDVSTLPDDLFRHGKGLRLIDCISSPDPRVSARLVDALDTGDDNTRLWAAYVLSGRLPLEDGLLRRLAPHLRDPSPDLHARLWQIFVAQSPVPDDVRRAVATHDPSLAGELQARGSRPR